MILLNQIKALIINTNSDSKAPDDFESLEAFCTKNSEVFSISFGPFNYTKVLTTDLANWSFSHSLYGVAPKPAPKPALDDDRIDD